MIFNFIFELFMITYHMKMQYYNILILYLKKCDIAPIVTHAKLIQSFFKLIKDLWLKSGMHQIISKVRS